MRKEEKCIVRLLLFTRSLLAVHIGQVRQQHLRWIKRGERHVRRGGGMRATRRYIQRCLRKWLRGVLHR